MKKITSSICIIFMLLSFSVTAFADGKNVSDVFYYSNKNDEVFSYITEQKEKLDLEVIYYFETVETVYRNNTLAQELNESYQLSEGEKIDTDKIKYLFDEFVCRYEWDHQSFLDFMYAEDKDAFLKKMTPRHYILPISYNGTKLEKAAFAIRYNKQNKEYSIFDRGLPSREWYTHLKNKQQVLDELEQKGINGYAPYHVAFLDGYYFIVVQKDGEFYAVYSELENREDAKMHEAFSKDSALADKQLYTKEDIKKIFEIYDALPAPVYDSNIDRSVIGPQSANLYSEKAESSPWQVVIICSVGVLVLFILLIIIKRKRRR